MVFKKKSPSYIFIRYSFFINFQDNFHPILLFGAAFLIIFKKNSLIYFSYIRNSRLGLGFCEKMPWYLRYLILLLGCFESPVSWRKQKLGLSRWPIPRQVLHLKIVIRISFYVQYVQLQSESKIKTNVPTSKFLSAQFLF